MCYLQGTSSKALVPRNTGQVATRDVGQHEQSIIVPKGQSILIY